MKQQEILHVDWNNKKSATYYIDKDKYSKAARNTPNEISLSAFEGVYVFNNVSGEIKLYTGVASKAVIVKKWNVPNH